ncbi:MAG: right-handed parallel beta-helix repeat-containing protein [Bacteroidetes bacterium]|nr:right-handed parallel beta-helix repeat-containing protein [Bacteroidota bacterium]
MTKSVKVTNTGNVPLNLSLATSSNFGISFTNSSYVNNLNVSLNTSQDTIIYIQFSPLQVQNYKDSLIFTADSLNTVKFPLEGNGFSGLMGNILQDTLICVDTLRIGSDITISSSARVTICSGTYVKIMGNYKVTVEGILEALGDSGNHVRFGVHDTVALWRGIYVYNPNPDDTSIFNYCDFIVNCNNPIIDIWKGIVSVDHCNFSNRKVGAGVISMYKIQYPCKLFISNSNIYSANSSAIMCNYCDSSYVINNHIYGNIMGIQFSTGNGMFITGNIIHDNIHEGIYGIGKMVIQKNEIYNNGGGIYFGGTDPIIENNAIYNNISSTVGGIYNGGGMGDGGGSISQNLIFNNQTTYGDGAGMLLVTSSNFNLEALITNNVICNNKAFRRGNNFYASTGNSVGIDLKLLNNIIYNVSDTNNNIAWSHNKGLEIQYNCINQDSINIWGQNNIDSKPKFVHPTDSIGK